MVPPLDALGKTTRRIECSTLTYFVKHLADRWVLHFEIFGEKLEKNFASQLGVTFWHIWAEIATLAGKFGMYFGIYFGEEN